jgi:dienelactone hydrolase
MDTSVIEHRPLRIADPGIALQADLSLPPNASGLVLFAHGSGSSRYSPRNRRVAEVLAEAGLATVLADLLTSSEETLDQRTRHLRFDIGLLGERLIFATRWLQAQEELAELPIGLFGASTGAAAALVAAAARPQSVRAIVSRGGRPDLAGRSLGLVRAPTLLVVGGDDPAVLELNREALAALTTEKSLRVVPGAGHLFEEPGTLDTAAALARDWFLRHLPLPRHA